MSLRLRLVAAFAFVALLTAGTVALATPPIVGRGFAAIEGTESGTGSGRGPGPMAGPHAQQVQQDTILTLIGVAGLAAVAASLLGLLLAGRIARPLGQLEEAAAAVAAGRLDRRSGLAGRSDELGSLGRSFDAMAADLEGADAARRRFFQDVVHELKTPLAVIEATTSAVLDGVYAAEDRHLDTIRDQARQLARVVDDLRTISLAETGALALTLAPTPVRPVLDAVARSFTVAADRAGSAISVTAPDGLVVEADEGRLRQALAALVDNAIRHAPGGPISLEAERTSGGIRIAVRDHGPGIAAADLAHVFERFYRADPSRDRSGGSSGLGLAIARAIAEAHRGSVGAQSHSGAGTLIWLELPAGRA